MFQNSGTLAFAFFRYALILVRGIECISMLELLHDCNSAVLIYQANVQ